MHPEHYEEIPVTGDCHVESGNIKVDQVDLMNIWNFFEIFLAHCIWLLIFTWTSTKAFHHIKYDFSSHARINILSIR